MFESQAIGIVIVARGVARGVDAGFEQDYPNLVGFADSGPGFFYRSAADWAEASVVVGTDDFHHAMHPFSRPYANDVVGPRMLSVEREHHWIVACNGSHRLGWFGAQWSDKGWKLQFVSCQAMPDFAPQMSLDEAKRYLKATLGKLGEYLGCLNGNGYCQQINDLATMEDMQGLQSNCKPWCHQVSDEAKALWSYVSAIPRLSGMGSVGDLLPDDFESFNDLIGNVSDAKCRAYEAIANSAYSDLPLIGEAERNKLRFKTLSRFANPT